MSGTNEWSTEEVCKKVKAELGLTDGDTFILDRIRENKITGSTLSEITLADCKELCPDSISAVRLKTCINKFVDTEEQAPEQELVLTMKGLHQTLNEKLQEFQSNYAQLRLDLLEIVKRNSGSGSGSSQSSQQLQHQPSSQDYFDRAPHHSSHTPSSPKIQIEFQSRAATTIFKHQKCFIVTYCHHTRIGEYSRRSWSIISSKFRTYETITCLKGGFM